MKKKVLIFTVIMFAALFIQAQKFAYVDTEYILDNIPEFAEAQSQLDEISSQWQKRDRS